MNRNVGTERILRRYGIAGSVVSEEELCGGNVNLTYKVTVRDGASFQTYLVQKINQNAMPSAKECVRNMALVTDHLQRKGIRTAKLYAVARSGERFVSVKNASGEEEEWRVEEYLPSVALNQENPDVLREMARAFGRCDAALADLDAAKLHETVRGFHDTYARYRQLYAAAEADVCSRTRGVSCELAQLKAMEQDACEVSLRYAAGEYPVRVTHNDTKFNNVLFTSANPPYDPVVIDFDTVMAGMYAYDFADSVRSVAKVTGGSAEHPTAVIDLARFRAIAEGYVSETAAIMTPAESEAMVPCVLAVTAELAARYLTDYLEGDRYFKIAYPEQNRDKARLNLALAQDIVRRRAELTEIYEEVLKKRR